MRIKEKLMTAVQEESKIATRIVIPKVLDQGCLVLTDFTNVTLSDINDGDIDQMSNTKIVAYFVMPYYEHHRRHSDQVKDSKAEESIQYICSFLDLLEVVHSSTNRIHNQICPPNMLIDPSTDTIALVGIGDQQALTTSNN